MGKYMNKCPGCNDYRTEKCETCTIDHRACLNCDIHYGWCAKCCVGTAKYKMGVKHIKCRKCELDDCAIQETE